MRVNFYFASLLNSLNIFVVSVCTDEKEKVMWIKRVSFFSLHILDTFYCLIAMAGSSCVMVKSSV